MKAVESLLIEKGMVSGEAIDAITNAYEHDIGPLRGAGGGGPCMGRRGATSCGCLSMGSAAIAELGITGFGAEAVVAVENTPRGAQRRRLHTVLLLPVGAARAAAELVQDAPVPRPRRSLAARRPQPSSA